MDNLSKVIEAILFVSGTPVNIDFLSKILNVSKKDINEAVNKLIEDKYNRNISGIIINKINDDIVFSTSEEHFNVLEEYFNFDKQKELTTAALEVLSIIAYKQPITKAEIDMIRGVKSDHIISKLISDDFIYISDRLDAPGLPNLYSTTNKFLLKFNLESLDDLPEIPVEEGEEV